MAAHIKRDSKSCPNHTPTSWCMTAPPPHVGLVGGVPLSGGSPLAAAKFLTPDKYDTIDWWAGPWCLRKATNRHRTLFEGGSGGTYYCCWEVTCKGYLVSPFNRVKSMAGTCPVAEGWGLGMGRSVGEKNATVLSLERAFGTPLFFPRECTIECSISR
uniref:Uncharacterized protein n=1 Tax=Amphimedon queenslandica TaxID=400682 RepID=A0A1X7TFR1_AMPQE